jgi:MFS transporter, ACS family, glucarate transporter
MRQSPWSVVALLSATATASYLCRVNMSVVGALLMGEFHLSQIAMGRVFSAFVLGYALAQIPAGMLADRWGARRVLLASAWAWVITTVLQVVVGLGSLGRSPASAFTVLLACRFAVGLSEAPTFPAAAQGVVRWIPPGAQGRANGFVLGAIGLGSAIAPPLISFLMVGWGWRVALVGSAVPALGVALIWLKVAEPPGAAILKVPGRSPRTGRAFDTRSFALLTASYTLQGYVGYIFVFWFYLYLVQERHFDLLRGSWLASLPWVLSLVSIPLGGFVADRFVASRRGHSWGHRLVPIVGLAGSGVCTAVGAGTSNAYIAAVALALATACVLSVEGPFWAAMMKVAGSRTGMAGGVMNMGSNLGGLISPVLTPALAAWIGWERALDVAAGMAVLAALLWFGILVRTDQCEHLSYAS